MADQVQLQRAYYAKTAATYDQAHLGDPEHHTALAFLLGVIGQHDIRSILDVGAGTGRALLPMEHMPTIHAIGLEPSAELRAIGTAKGLTILDGDVQALDFEDGAFDLVCAFGVLHHVPEPRRAIREMLRVAKRAVLISDNNDFGRGSFARRTIKQVLHALHLWRLTEFLTTGGKGYRITPDDGLWYSFSLFDHLAQIETACSRVHMLNTDGRGPNLFRTSGHVAILGLKD